MGERTDKKRILIVEDEDVVLDIYNMLLGDKYELTVRKNGIEGLKEALDNNINCIILDVMMPGMDGLDFLTLYNQRIPERKRVPVIVVTGSQNIPASKIKSYGIDALFYKPFKNEKLEECVDKYAH